MIRSIIEKIFSNPYGYRYVRGLFYFGLRISPIKKALSLKPGDSLLDFACGTGDYSVIVDSPQNTYLGVDLDEKYIKTATLSYGAPYRKFFVDDLLKMNLPDNSFNKALYSGVMHHLDERQNLEILAEINRITKDRVVIMDLSPGGWHFINNLLCKFDRGHFPRPLEKQIELLQKVMNVVSAKNYFARSGVQRFSLIICEPKK